MELTGVVSEVSVGDGISRILVRFVGGPRRFRKLKHGRMTQMTKHEGESLKQTHGAPSTNAGSINRVHVLRKRPYLFAQQSVEGTRLFAFEQEDAN